MWFGFAAAALFCYCRFPEMRRTFHIIGGIVLALAGLATCMAISSGHP